MYWNLIWKSPGFVQCGVQSDPLWSQTYNPCPVPRPADTSAEAEAARKSGIVMVAVGVGNNVEEEELERISGSKSMSIHVGSYDALYDILDKLTVKVCDSK